jgi:predicted nucleic acid-binding protein
MPVKVIDASALAAVVFAEPDAAAVMAAAAGSSLVAPSLLRIEVASVCLKKIRARPHQRSAFLAAFQLAYRLDIETAQVELPQAIELAEHAGLSLYDACYLWLSRALGCELLTLDKRLAAANKR